MLGDYVDRYIEALKNDDKEEMNRIEKDLEKVGMDRRTLRIIVNDKITWEENKNE